MTLIVGIICSDGIVMGSDTAVTLAVLGQKTAQQPSKKLNILHGCIIVGVSGPLSLAQPIQGVIGEMYHGNSFTGKKPHEAQLLLRKHLWENCIAQEFSIAAESQKVLGNLAQITTFSHTLIAMPISKQLCLFHSDETGATEAATSSLPFFAIGSGEQVADPFLAFVRRIFWPDHEPNLAEGIFAIWWTLDYAIKSAPSLGIADPKHIAVLETVAGKPTARELSDSDLKEHIEAVGRAQNYLRDFPKRKPEDVETTRPIPEPSQPAK